MAAITSLKVALEEPLKLEGGGELTELSLRLPRARDLRTMKVSGTPDMGMILDLAAGLANLTTAELDEISAADAMEVVSLLSPFLVKDGGTTQSPSSPTPRRTPCSPLPTFTKSRRRSITRSFRRGSFMRASRSAWRCLV